MKYYLIATTLLTALIFSKCKSGGKQEISSFLTIGAGQMPNATNDSAGNIHLVFGTGDSIMYSLSGDQGKSFSSPVLVSTLPGLYASHMRGPQIAAMSGSLIIIASNKSGDIFSYKKIDSGNWQPTEKVNDIDTVAKEGLMALSADAQMIYAVWLDLRDKHNKVFGSGSTDGGQSWSRNALVYASPDTTVCECCKPSVIVKGNNVYVMFRNWLNGNRDLYLVQSNDGGLTFSNAKKLGTGSWALNGCPMDGGGLAIRADKLETVWNRRGKIYACEPGKEEQEIGEGRNCTLETVNNKIVYAWIEQGDIVCKLPKTRQVIGKGRSLVMKAVNENQVICIWENENIIHSTLLNL